MATTDTHQSDMADSPPVEYCICRSSDSDRFMIGCDNCNEWYHGDCISVTERDAKKIKKFFCDFCRAKDGTLKIVYKSSIISSGGGRSSSSGRAPDHHSHHSTSASSKKSSKSSAHHRHGRYHDDKSFIDDDAREPSKKRLKLDRGSKIVASGNDSSAAAEETSRPKSSGVGENHQTTERSSTTDSVGQMSNASVVSVKSHSASGGHSGERCGKCIGCFRNFDCGKCDGCKTMKKFGGPGGNNRLPCEMRKCVNRGSKMATLPLPTGQLLLPAEPTTDMENRLHPVVGDKSSNPTVDTTKKEVLSPTKPDANNSQKQYDGVKLKHVQRNKNKKSTKGIRATWSDQQPINNDKHRQGGVGSTAGLSKKLANLMMTSGQSGPPGPGDNGTRMRMDDGDAVQCLGPQCVNAARVKSNYCSDACGLKLATLRLKALMPGRLEQFNAHGGSAASLRDAGRIAAIHSLQSAGKTQMGALDRRERQLNDACERARKHVKKAASGCAGGLDSKPGMSSEAGAAEKSAGADSSADSDQSVFCVTCGHEVGLKSALRHMAKCAAKYESQTSYGSSFQTTNDPYNLFCDSYNRVNQTYCKRLRIICPEHYKEPKVEDNEICGYPAGKGDVTGRCLFGSDDEEDGSSSMVVGAGSSQFSPSGASSSRMCEDLRKRCVKHYKWERTQRAMIALERLSILLKMEELWEEEVSLQSRIANRCSVLGLMLHDTKREGESDEGEEIVDMED